MLEQGRGIADARRAIARGERPVFHVVTTFDGAAVDVRLLELPVVHLYVPDSSGVLEGARSLVARTLEVDPWTFGVEMADPTIG